MTQVVATVVACLLAAAWCIALTVYATARMVQAARRRCGVQGTVITWVEPLAWTALAVGSWWTFLAVALFGHDVSVP